MRAARSRRPTPALGIGMIALFVALAGTAGAVGSAAVPLAKRALVADKAKLATTAKLANSAKTATRAKVVQTAVTANLAANAGTLGGQTSAQIVAAAAAAASSAAVEQSPPGARPASTAAGLVVHKSGIAQLAANDEGGFVLDCGGSTKAAHGGVSPDPDVVAFDSYPTNGGASWAVYLVNTDAVNPASSTVYVTCIG